MEPEQMLEGQTQVPGGLGFRVVVCSEKGWLMSLTCVLFSRLQKILTLSTASQITSRYAVSVRLLRAGENLGSIFTRLLCTRENFHHREPNTIKLWVACFISGTNTWWYTGVQISFEPRG